MNFWKWFFRGAGDPDDCPQVSGEIGHSRPGILAYFDIWLIFHLCVGAILMLIVPIRINEAARSILLPLAGIFIGLTFAWGGNAVSLMQSDEINMIADHHQGGLQVYVFKFQSAILVLLITMVCWGFAGLNVFESLHVKQKLKFIYAIIEIILYFFISLSLRDCWHVVMGAQSMILLRRSVKKVLEQKRHK
jgi:hypothetical protein